MGRPDYEDSVAQPSGSDAAPESPLGMVYFGGGTGDTLNLLTHSDDRTFGTLLGHLTESEDR